MYITHIPQGTQHLSSSLMVSTEYFTPSFWNHVWGFPPHLTNQYSSGPSSCALFWSVLTLPRESIELRIWKLGWWSYPPLQMPSANPGCEFNVWLAVTAGVPPPSPTLWLNCWSRTRENTLSLLVYWPINIGYDNGNRYTARWKQAEEKAWGGLWVGELLPLLL